MSAPRRIGILGGSFDPVHRGHLHAARAAMEAKALDRVVFVPAGQSPNKVGRPMESGAHRLTMLGIAIRDEPHFSTSDIELVRGGTSYTIDTVRALRKQLGEPEDSEIFLIIGSDNVPGLPAWREARALLGLVQPVVVDRDGDARAALAIVRRVLGDELAEKVSAGWLSVPPLPASSTDLRDQLAGLTLSERDVERAGLEPAVLEYIRARGLYGTKSWPQ
jgi:nicotinate-nucleotide adenylyltransferase